MARGRTNKLGRNLYTPLFKISMRHARELTHLRESYPGLDARLDMSIYLGIEDVSQSLSMFLRTIAKRTYWDES